MGDETHVGNILWFDQKKGFGFVRIFDLSSQYNEKDIFFHFSEIKCDNSFKKVFPGEYVSLEIVNVVEDKERPLTAKNIKGVNGGPLLIDNEKYIYKIYEKKGSRGSRKPENDANEEDSNVEDSNVEKTA